MVYNLVMKKSERKKLLSLYGHLYERHYEVDPNVCFYCGDTREVLDHRPPLAVLDDIGSERMRSLEIPFVLIPCCTGCNSCLGSKAFLTAQEATSHMVKKLEKDYDARMSLWTDAEIREMSPMFKTIIRAKREMLKRLHSRLVFAQKREFDFDAFPVFRR
jgi:hypothetical protein